MRISNLAQFFFTLPSTLAYPSQPPINTPTNTTLPSHFAILVYPHFQALDVFGPLDVLNTFAMLYSNTTMHLSVLAKTLDPVSTAMEAMPGMKMGNVDFGQKIVPTSTFQQVLDGNGPEEKGDVDVLIVPGGGGSRRNVTEEIAFLKAMFPKVKYMISVCTGASLLARAGILDGRRATTNKRSWAWATSTGPNVTWVHTARWVEDGNVWTSSGISAGIDVTYGWLGHVYGEEVADYLAKTSEYERWTNSTYDPFAAVWDGYPTR